MKISLDPILNLAKSRESALYNGAGLMVVGIGGLWLGRQIENLSKTCKQKTYLVIPPWKETGWKTAACACNLFGNAVIFISGISVCYGSFLCGWAMLAEAIDLITFELKDAQYLPDIAKNVREY